MLLPPPVEELDIVSAVRTMQSLKKQGLEDASQCFAEAITQHLNSQSLPLIREEVEAIWNGFPKRSQAVARLIINLAGSRIRGELFDFDRIQHFAQRNPELEINLHVCCEDLMHPGSGYAKMEEMRWKPGTEATKGRKRRSGAVGRVVQSGAAGEEAREPFQESAEKITPTMTVRRRLRRPRSVHWKNVEDERLGRHAEAEEGNTRHTEDGRTKYRCRD
ncbi:hypothetical protein MPH_05400 [Macrophomina phaseolina MS6]|uniref:Uncharacterized protein n=1 Tax=Macrophomina phaseolina (strain MS6) TaxID=1126212 RepID=K2S472_MACPH|nr:hypothetical protein MPH_05400 [Macrophomina phaseolina MS6]